MMKRCWILNEAASLLPSDPRIHNISARASFLKADLQEALKKIDQALELMPESAEALGIKGGYQVAFNGKPRVVGAAGPVFKAG